MLKVKQCSMYLVVILLVSMLVGFDVPTFVPSFDIGTVVRVLDGDTVEVDLKIRGKQKIRIEGINSFETRNNKQLKRQIKEYNITVEECKKRGNEAKEVVTHFLLNKPVLIAFDDARYGYYGRVLGRLLFIHNGKWVEFNEHMSFNFSHLYTYIELWGQEDK